MTRDRSSWHAALHAPQSIAVIGASSNPQKIGGRTLANIRRGGFLGAVYPINPAGGTIGGWTAYLTLSDLPQVPDMAIIAVPGAEAVEVAVADCAAHAVKTCIVFSAGFAETNDEGRARQARMTAHARASGLRVLGPNSQGCLVAQSGLIASFATTFQEYAIADGPVAVISQSGAISAVLYGQLRQRGIGVRYVHATGNEADISVADLVEVVAGDPDIAVIALYLENITDALRLEAAAQRARDAGQLVFAVKAGASASGQKAAQSHTGALASDDAVVNAFLERIGVCRVDTLRALVDVVPLALQRRSHPITGIVAISNSGAACVLAADLCERLEIPLARISDLTKKALEAIVPANGNVENPIDLTPALLTNPDLLGKTLTMIAEDGDVDAVLLNLPGSAQGYDFPRYADDLAAYQARSNAAVAVVAPSESARLAMARTGAAVFEHDSDALHALATLKRAHVASRAVERAETLSPPLLPAEGMLSEFESLAILRQAGIPVIRHELCATVDEAIAARSAFAGPVVVKGCSRRFPHKSEYGLIVLDRRTDAEVAEAFAEVTQLMRSHGEVNPHVILAPFAKVRGEAFIGGRWDPEFGAVIVIGEGGKYAEARHDVVTLSWPFDEATALRAVESLRVSTIWNGVRGEPALDLAPLAAAAVRMGALVHTAGGSIASIDANPFCLGAPGEASLVLDSLIEATIFESTARIIEPTAQPKHI